MVSIWWKSKQLQNHNKSSFASPLSARDDLSYHLLFKKCKIFQSVFLKKYVKEITRNLNIKSFCIKDTEIRVATWPQVRLEIGEMLKEVYWKKYIYGLKEITLDFRLQKLRIILFTLSDFYDAWKKGRRSTRRLLMIRLCPCSKFKAVGN